MQPLRRHHLWALRGVSLRSGAGRLSALQPTPRVSVIIPNWNGARLLPGCLDSLRLQTYRDFETVVVDNGSKDESVALMRARYPEVRVLALPENRFFAGGVNAGIEATESPIVARRELGITSTVGGKVMAGIAGDISCIAENGIAVELLDQPGDGAEILDRGADEQEM